MTAEKPEGDVALCLVKPLDVLGRETAQLRECGWNRAADLLDSQSADNAVLRKALVNLHEAADAICECAYPDLVDSEEWARLGLAVDEAAKVLKEKPPPEKPEGDVARAIQSLRSPRMDRARDILTNGNPLAATAIGGCLTPVPTPSSTGVCDVPPTLAK